MVKRDDSLRALVQAIAGGDVAAARKMLATAPHLARECTAEGATRRTAQDNFLHAIGHYLYAGDTALHIAAAGYQDRLVKELIARDADVRARNPQAQAATIACLIEAGADPNALDKSGVAPLHRAVRTRCASAVKALLDGGADAFAKNKNGSTPMLLATRNTGRGGSGSPEAKAQQQEILRLLEEYGAAQP